MSLRNDHLSRRNRLLFLSLALALTVSLCSCGDQSPQLTRPPTEVTAVTVQPRTIPASYPFVAQVQSSHQVDIVARVNAYLEKISYQEGSLVQKGQTLFKLDQKLFLTAVESAKAEVEIRQSQLSTAMASYNRTKPLAEVYAASKSDLDRAFGEVKIAEASLHQAQANLDKANIELGYTVIRSPLTGVSGQSELREGGYIAAGSPSAKLTYVAIIDPAWVEFSISQNEQEAILREVKSGQLLPPKDSRFSIELELAEGMRYPLTGTLNFADPSFSKETGTYLVRASMPNPDGILRPGMFVKALVTGAVRPAAITVPQKAVQQSDNGQVVYIVNDQGKAEARPVTVGEWLDQDWIITQGIVAGEQVIVGGLMKVASGMPVKIVSPEPTESASPPAPLAVDK